MATIRAHLVGDATVIKILELALEYTEGGDLYPPHRRRGARRVGHRAVAGGSPFPVVG
jgi:hypothetical protein